MQGSDGHYCTPKDNTGPYTSVEVWCAYYADGRPSRALGVKASGPSGWVPVSKVNKLVRKHGGLKED